MNNPFVEKSRSIKVEMVLELYGNEDQMRRSMRKLEEEIELQHYNVLAFGWYEDEA